MNRFLSRRWLRDLVRGGLASAALVAPLALVLGPADPSSATPICCGPSIPSVGNATSAVVQQPNGSPSVFVQGQSGTLWNYWYVNGVWDAAEIVASGVASTPVAIESDAGLSDEGPSVFFEGPAHSLLNVWYIPSNGSWGTATVAFAGSAYSAPAVWQSSGCSCSVFVFVLGPSQSFVQYEYQHGGWPASAVPNVGPQPISSPSIGQPDQLYAAGGSNSLAEWGAPGWFEAFNTESQVAGPGTAYSSPAVMLEVLGFEYTSSVFFVGPGNSLLNYWFDNSGANQGAATVAKQGSATGLIGVTSQPNGSPSTFFEGPNGTLWNAWYVNGSWDLSQVGSGLASPNAHLSS